MGVRVNGGRVPGKKKARLAADARAWRWNPAVSGRLAAAGITAALLGIAACSSSGGASSPGASAAASSPAPSATAPASGSASSVAASSLEQQYEQVVAGVLPSVVQISTSEGSGSGVVYDAKGDIVTNAHVVGTATSLQVSLASGGKPLAAKVIGVFAPDDLAVIRVQGGTGSLHPAAFGRSAAVKVGEIVLAMGNPLGLTGTVTDGIVSATGRTVSEGQGSSAVLISAIQTSAAINPGNSGGALINLVGKVTSSGRASLGISAQTVADAAGQPAGVGIVSVTPGGAAARAGISAGDIITALAGQPATSLAALQAVLAAHKPGDRVQARLTRNGTTSTVTVTLGTLTS